jgi:hypothetical protein
MALAAKKIADTEFKVPSLADASPHYAELVERKANLLASKLEAETQLSRDQVAFRARPSQMSEKVAVLVGDVAPGESTYPTAIRMREQATNIAALTQAITVIDTRINSERGKASLIVCDQVRDEHRRLVREVCFRLMDLREAMMAYQLFADTLNDQDIAWSSLSPSQSRTAAYLREKLKEGFLDPKEIPARFR